MACADCFKSLREMQEALLAIQKQAKAYAIANEKTVFIYQSDYGWSFMEEEKAITLGIQPTGGVISQYQQTNN
jgi:hypothetical protein